MDRLCDSLSGSSRCSPADFGVGSDRGPRGATDPPSKSSHQILCWRLGGCWSKLGSRRSSRNATLRDPASWFATGATDPQDMKHGVLCCRSRRDGGRPPLVHASPFAVGRGAPRVPKERASLRACALPRGANYPGGPELRNYDVGPVRIAGVADRTGDDLVLPLRSRSRSRSTSRSFCDLRML